MPALTYIRIVLFCILDEHLKIIHIQVLES